MTKNQGKSSEKNPSKKLSEKTLNAESNLPIKNKNNECVEKRGNK